MTDEEAMDALQTLSEQAPKHSARARILHEAGRFVGENSAADCLRVSRDMLAPESTAALTPEKRQAVLDVIALLDPSPVVSLVPTVRVPLQRVDMLGRALSVRQGEEGPVVSATLSGPRGIHVIELHLDDEQLERIAAIHTDRKMAGAAETMLSERATGEHKAGG